MNEFTDEELLEALEIDLADKAPPLYSAEEERLMAGFDDILRFLATHKRLPRHNAEESNSIFERLYAVRLDALRALCQENAAHFALLRKMDEKGVLLSPQNHLTAAQIEAFKDDELLNALEISTENNLSEPSQNDISVLRYVTDPKTRNAAEEIANKTPCADFLKFKPFFIQAENELKNGVREARPFLKNSSIEADNFFILGGMLIYIAEIGEAVKAPNGETDARLRVIYSNGTESNLLHHSLQRAFYKDDAARRLTIPDFGPLFSSVKEENDITNGTLYVLRSLSAHPFVKAHQSLIHKIGITSGRVENRISNAENEATYLLAKVEIVATYALININPIKLEALFHKLFASAQIEIEIIDRFGKKVAPREWFLVPLAVIDEAVLHLQNGKLENLSYEPKSASFIKSA